jgi:hypothetical protein
MRFAQVIFNTFEAYSAEGQLDAVPLEPLPVERTFLILRVSGNLIINDLVCNRT